LQPSFTRRVPPLLPFSASIPDPFSVLYTV
jgi:hypothetical protein